MESFKPLRDLAQKMETKGDVTEKDVQDTITAVKEDLKAKFGNNPQKLEEINKRLASLETLWKEKVTALKAAKDADKQKIITETKGKLAEVELEAGKQLTPPQVPAASPENQPRLTAIAGEKEALKKSLTRENSAWTKAAEQPSLIGALANLGDVKGFISESFKQPKIAEMLIYAGINDDANKAELAAAMETVAKEFMSKGGTMDKGADVAKPLVDLLNNLKDYYESEKKKADPNFPYESPNAMLRSFSDFTETKFIDDAGKIQKNNLVTVMKYSDPTLKLFLDKFKLYVPLLQEEKKLGGGPAQPQIPNAEPVLAAAPVIGAAPVLAAAPALEGKEKDVKTLIDFYCSESKIDDPDTRKNLAARLHARLDREAVKKEEVSGMLKDYFKEILFIDPDSDVEKLKKLKLDDLDKERETKRAASVKKFLDRIIGEKLATEDQREKYSRYLLGALSGRESGGKDDGVGWDRELVQIFNEIRSTPWKDLTGALFKDNLSAEAKDILAEDKAEKARLYVAGLIASVAPERGYKDWKVLVDGEKKEFTDVYRAYVKGEMDRIGREIGEHKGGKGEEYYWDKVKDIKTSEKYWNELWQNTLSAAAPAQPQPAPEVVPPPQPQPGPEAPPAGPPAAPDAPPAAPPAAPGEPAPAATTDTPPEGMPFSTGDVETDKWVKRILPFIAGLFPAIVPMLRTLGFKIDIEFGGLDTGERRQAKQMKETMNKLDLNMETLKPLFMNDEQMKLILKKQKEEKISWKDYLKKYLTSAETEELKKAQTLEPKAMADMLLSPGESPVA